MESTRDHVPNVSKHGAVSHKSTEEELGQLFSSCLSAQTGQMNQCLHIPTTLFSIPLVCFLYSQANVPPRSCQIGEFMLASSVQSGRACPSSGHWKDADPDACVGLWAKERHCIMKTKPHHLTVSPIRGNMNPLVRQSPGDAVHSHGYVCKHKLRDVHAHRCCRHTRVSAHAHTHTHTRRQEHIVCCQVEEVAEMAERPVMLSGPWVIQLCMPDWTPGVTAVILLTGADLLLRSRTHLTPVPGSKWLQRHCGAQLVFKP